MSSGSGPRPNTTTDDDHPANNTTRPPTTPTPTQAPASASGRRTSASNAPKIPHLFGLRSHKGQHQGSNIPKPTKSGSSSTSGGSGSGANVSAIKKFANANKPPLFVPQQDHNRNPLGRKSEVGGSDHETERQGQGQGWTLYRTTSPLFTVKSDAELDKSLEKAMELQLKDLTNEKMDLDEGGFEFIECHGHPPQWKTFLDDNILCDCTIQSNDGKIFPAHRCILAASCPFFYEKYCSKPQTEGSHSLSSIILKTVDASTLQSIIDYVYTGQFTKNVESTSKLLPIASKFKMTPVMQQCCSYLVDNLSPDNALRLYSLCRPHFCPKLESKAKSYILHNFRQVIRTQDFLDLEPDKLKTILKDDRLNARNEAMVFEAIRAWVEANPGKRRKIIPEMLSCVRFGLMSYGYFTNVVYQWHFVNEDEAVRRALDGPSVLLTSIDSLNNTDVDLNDPLARPRIPYEVIFAVGGWSAGSPTAFIETYDIRADRWFLLNNSDSTPRAYHGLVAVGQYVYMIGGFDGQEHFSTVKRYDPVTQEWEERSCMLFARCYVSCCQLDGIIYACGGYNGRTRMASGEKYHPGRNQWEIIAPMNRPRSDASAASIRGKVYIAGGFTGTEVLNSVEVYDPNEDQWTFIQTMNSARSGVSLVAYRDCLYAVGGFNGFNRLNTAERYDPEELGAWKYIPDMSSARSNFAAVCADELLICIGGFNGATTIPYVECYDSKVNEWFDASHMNLNRSALSACVVNNLPNSHEYSYLHRIQELLGLPTDLVVDMEVDD